MSVAQLPLIHPLFFVFLDAFCSRFFNEKGGKYASGKETQRETAANDNVTQ